MRMLIVEYPGAVSVELCEQIIACFERDPARKASAVMVDGVATTHQFRSGTMASVNRQSKDWESAFMAVVPALRSTMESYISKHPGLANLVEWEGLDCTLPLIERVDPGQGFDWHYDNTLESIHRVVAGLLYLRTITAGGETEFAIDNRRVQSEAGKIVLFPPYWTHYHRGVTPVAETKYVMSFFWTYPGKSA
jgi:predicted 2-oxoglutarate/Fe(II)-dependent dioxygenase YbiX